MQRVLKYLVMVFCVLALVAPDVADAAAKKKKPRAKARISQSRMVIKKHAAAIAGTADPRYAALIMNPVTGEIYHSANADARRYPASLTKMMTLYLLFEALEKKQISLSTRMDVSNYAAGMPQTNLHLSEGDEIPVEVAIKALVVRSANDVSVVVAETLAGDVDAFAERMTAKARALGMRNTVFKNPNGLPDEDQHTTARDMAKLGIALKRDFPKYYPYFATRQFSWNGATYYTHNRVMLRYSGTDGIKTGYVRASGFNLVTSVKRGGRPLVGVVLGGASGRWRDDRMIALLDASYQKIAERGAARGQIYSENLPTAKGGKTKAGVAAPTADEENSDVMEPTTLDDNAVAQPEEAAEDVVEAAPTVAARSATPLVTAMPERKEPPQSYIRIVPAKKPEESTMTVAPPLPSGTHAAPNTSPFAAATVATTHAGAENMWGIQVGAFSSHELAVKAVTQAAQLAKTPLAGSAMEIMGPEVGGAPVYRARLTHLSQRQSRDACEKLIANNTPCFIFQAGN